MSKLVQCEYMLKTGKKRQDRRGPCNRRPEQCACFYSCFRPTFCKQPWGTAALFLTVIGLLTGLVIPEVIHRPDPMALLSATLKTYQRAGCDSDHLSLSCPRGTSISIQLAQYGRAGDLSDHSMCPPISQEVLILAERANPVMRSKKEIEVKAPEKCMVNRLQYALLQAVVDACQKKSRCKFAANFKTLSGEDPCAVLHNYVEIAYTCRPYEFRSKVACENGSMHLMCNPYSRIAIYSASFGHIEHKKLQCEQGEEMSGSVAEPNDDNSKPTCLVSYATETVMQICHGRRRCFMTADAGTFGRPCRADVRMSLNVVYTCIPRKVLKNRFETVPEADEPQQVALDLDQGDFYRDDQFYKKSEAISPSPNLQGAISNVGLPIDFSEAAAGVDPSSTYLPPYRAQNNGSLDESLLSSLHILNRIMAYINNNTDTENGGVHVDGKTNGFQNDTILDNFGTEDTSQDKRGKENFINNFKCMNVDDWGVIGLNCTKEDILTERVSVVGFLINWLHTYIHIKKHKEQFYFYLIISVAAGVLLCLTLVIFRTALKRRRREHKKKKLCTSRAFKNFDDVPAGKANI